jgi:Predicted membrane protein
VARDVGILRLLPVDLPLPNAPAVSDSRALAYAALLAVTALITTSVAIAGDLGHPGGWLIMTPFIVLQPYVQEGWDRSLRRAGGTLLGFTMAYLGASVIAQSWLLYVVGTVSYAIAMYALLRQWDYVVYAAFLTLAIVILEGVGASVEVTAEYRLEATAGGVVLSLVAMALALPLYRRAARKYQLEEY